MLSASVDKQLKEHDGGHSTTNYGPHILYPPLSGIPPGAKWKKGEAAA